MSSQLQSPQRPTIAGYKKSNFHHTNRCIQQHALERKKATTKIRRVREGTLNADKIVLTGYK